jgi:hypothetical protein
VMGPCSRPESERIHYSVVERLTGDFAVLIDDLILRFRKDREVDTQIVPPTDLLE